MVISEKNLEAIKAIVSKRSGLSLEGKKGYGLKDAVSTAFSASGCNSVEDYIYKLSTPSFQSRIELDKLISLLTIKETYFFRDRHQFDVLRNFILPEIINKKRGSDKKIKIWSAGCATGEEAYSIAITLFELIPAIDSWDISLLATDIDADALSKAQKGEFRKWSFRGVSADIIERYFTLLHTEKPCFSGRSIKGSAAENNIYDIYSINDKFKKIVTFESLNLKEDRFPSILNNTNDMDIIICRNVTIYFSRESTKEVINKFYNSLNEGGYLLVGHSEHFSEYYKSFVVKAFPHTIAYQKLAASQAPKRQILGAGFKGISFRDVCKDPSEAKERDTEAFTTLRKTNDSEETIIFKEAVQLFKENKYNDASERLIEILELNPKNARACVMLAQISANRGDAASAVKWCEEAIKADNLNLDAYYLLSVISQDSGDLTKAASLLKKVVYINTSHVLGYFDLGMVHKKLHKEAEAKRYFEAAKELLAKKPKMLKEMLGEKDADELEEVIDRELMQAH